MIEIVYTGSLDAYDPESPKYKLKSGLKKWFLPYNALTTLPHTRSGYFLFKGIQKALKNYCDLPKKLHFSFYGSIDPLNIAQVKDFGIENMVDFHSYVPKKELAEIEKNANAFFLPLESGSEEFSKPLFIPGKMFEYMKWEKPIISLCGTSDVKAILEKSGLGICLAPENADAIAMTLVKMATQDEFERIIEPNKDYIASFAFEKIAARYADLINELS